MSVFLLYCLSVIESAPLLTRATLENIVRLQLEGHDHAVKLTQLSRRYQHSEEDMSSQWADLLTYTSKHTRVYR